MNALGQQLQQKICLVAKSFLIAFFLLQIKIAHAPLLKCPEAHYLPVLKLQSFLCDLASHTLLSWYVNGG